MLDRLTSAKFVRLLAFLSVGAVALAVLTYTRADPDLWGNVRFGADIVTARTARLADHYSFLSNRAWINHEWLAEVVMYGAFRLAGGAGLIALKMLLVAAMLGAVATVVRSASLPPIAKLALLGVALVATVPQTTHVRPQLFSLALFSWLLILLVGARTSRAVVLLIVPLVWVWANLHGGWIVGVGMLGLWCAAGTIGGRSLAETSRLLVVILAAIAATAVNPYGFEMWSFLRDTVGFGRADIVDWQPIYAMGGMYLALWMLTAAVLAAAIASAVRAKSIDLQALAIPLALAVASFRVNRLLGFFALATVILATPSIRLQLRRQTQSDVSRPEPFWRHAMALVVFVTVCVAAVNIGATNATCVRVDDVFSPRPGVVEFVDSHQLRGRMLTWFEWGHYAIWHWADRGIEVSIDGRRETVYSDDVIRDHLRFYFDAAARPAVLARLQPDYIWLPADLDATGWLTHHGWQAVFQDERSVLLAPRDRVALTMATGPELRASRCFPGP